ncbi:MAG: hypothetical protein GY803_15330 [Chloroflexi bacterium]|nr:hypothetical protein [Chloroflexota bacterium]
MARKKAIPQDIREQVIAIIERFNEENSLPPQPNPMQQVMKMLGMSRRSQPASQYRCGEYVPRFRGAFLYLDRADYGEPSQICRLKWTGDMNDWDFAIYKHSRNRYAPDEWFFPGIEEVDGTVAGAMRAGLKAYPI